MRRIGSWYVIYNRDGTFRGYEGIRYDADGNALPSQVYAQEGRDALGKPLPVADTAQPVAAEAGRPVTQPDRDDLDVMRHE